MMEMNGGATVSRRCFPPHLFVVCVCPSRVCVVSFPNAAEPARRIKRSKEISFSSPRRAPAAPNGLPLDGRRTCATSTRAIFGRLAHTHPPFFPTIKSHRDTR